MDIFTDNLIALANQVKFYTSEEYIPNAITVSRNGVVLGQPEVDSSFGTYILLTTPANEGDEITITGSSAAGASGLNTEKNTFLERLGFNFDKSRFGSALTASGLNTSYYKNNPVKLKEWQKRFLKSGTYGNYFKNPMESVIVTMRNNFQRIVTTIDEILIAITPIYGPFGTVVNSPKLIPPEKATENNLRLLANTATQTLNELNLFLSHTDRISGVKTTVSDDPDYETAIRVGTNITQLVNSIDGVDDFSPALGSFTSLFIRDELAAYSNSVENFLNEDNEIINIDTWSASNYFDDTTIYSSDWTVLNSQIGTSTLDISSVATISRSITFKPDGSMLFLAASTPTDQFIQYDLTESWNIASATNLKTLTINSTSNPNYSGTNRDPHDLFIRNDGKKLYHTDISSGNDKIFEYDLSEAWNVQTAVSSTGSFLQIYRLDGVETDSNPRSLFFNKDGDILIVSQGADDVLMKFELSTPWSIKTANLVSTSVAIDLLAGSDVDGVQPGMIISSDGKKLIGLDNPTDAIRYYTLEKAWDITTIQFKEEYFVTEYVIQPTGFYMQPSGNTFYVLSNTDDSLYDFNILPSGTLNFSDNDANTMIQIFTEIKDLVRARRTHDKNYYLNSLRILNDYNKMVQLTSIPNPAAIVLIRDLIGTDSLKNLL